MAHERLFDYPFEFQKYIEEQLRDIDDIDERKFAKTIMMDGLLNIIKETERKYEALEQRVYDEIENEAEKYAIRMTIIKRSDYDPTNPTWFPVLDEDLQDRAAVTAEEITAALNQGESVRVGSVYIEGDDEMYRKLEESETPLMGTLLTDKGEINARFQLRKSEAHREKIAKLYALFHDNTVPWTTVLSVYLEKCCEIRLLNTETPLSDKMKIEKIIVDYGSYANVVREDIIPLWNVEKIQYNCDQFPVPCLDSVNFEHEFPTKTFGAENGFLLEKNAEISGFRYDSDRIYVATPCVAFSMWNAWRIITSAPVPSLGYTYPVLSNAKRESFSKIFLRHARTALKSKADLYRRVNEMGLEKFVRYLGCQIITKDEEGYQPGDMNWFINDEIFDQTISRILLLKFEPVEKENYLNSAIVRYIVSEIQQSQAEYRCMGVLIE